MASYRSTGTYVDAVPPPGTNVISGRWLYKVKWPPGSPLVFKACYVVRGFTRLRVALIRLFHRVLSREPARADMAASPAWLHWLFPTWDPVAAALTSLRPASRSTAARTITLTQSHMVEKILTRFHFPFSKVQLTPLVVDHGLTAPPLDESFESSGPYPELVGCLMYLMTCTRPDLAYPLSVLACFVAPGRHQPSHWYVAKRVAKYVASTSVMELVLGGKQPVTLTGYSDSSWADDAETCRST
ncbi:unnamed protein product [Closterium sp. NIES-54]